MLRDEIQKSMIEAMKAQEKLKLEALRYVWSLIKNEEIEVKEELNDEQVVKVVASEVKKRREAIEPFDSFDRAQDKSAQGKQDEKTKRWVRDEKEKLAVLMAFLPEQMSKEEIGNLVSEVIRELGEKDFGKVMREVMKRIQGRADGKLVSDIVKNKIAGPDTIS